MADIKKEKEEIEYDEEDYDEEFSDEDDDIQMVDPTKEHPLEREWAVYYDAELLFKQPANREKPTVGSKYLPTFCLQHRGKFLENDPQLAFRQCYQSRNSLLFISKRSWPNLGSFTKWRKMVLEHSFAH